MRSSPRVELESRLEMIKSGRPPFRTASLGALRHLYGLRMLLQNEEGCHSAAFRTLIHFRHHLLFYKDGGFEPVLPSEGNLYTGSITQKYSGVNIVIPFDSRVLAPASLTGLSCGETL